MADAVSTTALPASTNVILPPLEAINEKDLRGLVSVITALLLSFVLVCFGIRLFVRTRICGPWKWDDTILTIATFLCCAHAAASFVMVSHGYGQIETQLSNSDSILIGKAIIASRILYLIILCLSKCSMAFLFLRLSPHGNQSLASWAAISFSIIWVLLSIMLLSINCNLDPANGDLVLYCPGLIITSLDIATEGALFLISIALVAKLQMTIKMKVIVIVVFGLRLPVVLAAAIRLYYVKLEYTTTDSPNTFPAVMIIIMSMVQLDYSIISATIPCLGPFISPFSLSYQDSHYGKSGSNNSSSGTRSTTDYDLDAVKTKHNQGDDASYNGRGMDVGHKWMISTGGIGKNRGVSVSIDEHKLRPDQFSHESTVESMGGRTDQQSIESNSSRRMIIRKNMEWLVVRD